MSCRDPLEPRTLHSDAEALRDAAAVMRAHALAQEQAVARLAAAWTGEAADAALAALGRRLDRARADCATVAAAAATLDGAADLVRDALAAQADFGERFGAGADGPGDRYAPGPAVAGTAPHVREWIAALTELFAVIDLVVDGARTVVEQALDVVGGDAEPAPGEWPEYPVSVPQEGAGPRESVADQEGDVPLEEAEAQQDSVLHGLADPAVTRPDPAPVADPPAPAPDDVSDTLGFGAGAATQRDRPRAGTAPADTEGESDTGAELADAGRL